MLAIGSALQKAGFFFLTLSGIWGFGLSLWVIHDFSGLTGVLISIFIAPIAFFLAPIYAGFWLDDWIPAAVSFLMPAASWALVFAGASIQGERE